VAVEEEEEVIEEAVEVQEEEAEAEVPQEMKFKHSLDKK